MEMDSLNVKIRTIFQLIDHVFSRLQNEGKIDILSPFPKIEYDELESIFYFRDESIYDFEDEEIQNIIQKILTTSDSSNFNHCYSHYQIHISKNDSINQSKKKFISTILIKCILINRTSNDSILDIITNLYFDNDFFPSNPLNSNQFSYIKMMNNYLYQLYTICSTTSRQFIFSNINTKIKDSIENKNPFFVYNFLPFINKLITNWESNDFYLLNFDSLFELALDNDYLYYFINKIFNHNPQFILKQELYLEYIKKYFSTKQYRESLLKNIIQGLQYLIEHDDYDLNIINHLNSILNFMDNEDLSLFLDLFIAISAKFKKFILNELLETLSILCQRSPDLFFKFLHLISKLNIEFELFDLPNSDIYFYNIKKCRLQREHLYDLFQFALMRNFELDKVNLTLKNETHQSEFTIYDDFGFYVANWRGIKLILSYYYLDELGIAKKLQSLSTTTSNLYELEKAGVTAFIINRLYSIDNNEIILEYSSILANICNIILTPLNFARLINLAKKSKHASIPVLLRGEMLIDRLKSPFSFFRLDRPNHYIKINQKPFANSISIYFAFELARKQYTHLLTLELNDKTYDFDIITEYQLSISHQKLQATTKLHIKETEWNFIHINVTITKSSVVFDMTVNTNTRHVVFKKGALAQLYNAIHPVQLQFSLMFKSYSLDVSSIFVFENDEIPFNFGFEDLNLHEDELSEELVSHLICCVDSSLIDKKSYFILNELNVEFNGRSFSYYPLILNKSFVRCSNEFLVKRAIQLFECLERNSFQEADGKMLFEHIMLIINFLKGQIRSIKTIKLLSILISRIRPEFISISGLNQLFDLLEFDSMNLTSKSKLRNELFQSLFMNFELISKLPFEIQNSFLNSILKIERPSYVQFEPIIQNAALSYQEEDENSLLVFKIISKLFKIKYLNRLIYTISNTNSIFVIEQCLNIIDDQIYSRINTQDEPFDIEMVKNQILHLVLILIENNNSQIQLLGFKLLISVDKWSRMNKSELNLNSTVYLILKHLNTSIDQIDFIIEKLAELILPEYHGCAMDQLYFQNNFLFPIFVTYFNFSKNLELRHKIQKQFKVCITNDIFGTSCFLNIHKWYFWIIQFFKDDLIEYSMAIFELLTQDIKLHNSDEILNDFFGLLSITYSNSSQFKNVLLDSLILHLNIDLIFNFIFHYFLTNTTLTEFHYKDFFDLLNDRNSIEIAHEKKNSNSGNFSKFFLQNLFEQIEFKPKIHSLILISYLYKQTIDLRSQLDNESILNEIRGKLNGVSSEIKETCQIILDPVPFENPKIQKNLDNLYSFLVELKNKYNPENFMSNFRETFYESIQMSKEKFNKNNYFINLDEFYQFNDFLIKSEKVQLTKFFKNYQNSVNQETSNEKYILTNQISLHGSRLLMKVNSNFNDYSTVLKFNKFESESPKRLELNEKQEFLCSQTTNPFFVMYIDLSTSQNGILCIIHEKVYFQGTTKTIRFHLNEIEYIFNRTYSTQMLSVDQQTPNNSQGIEILTNFNRSYCFIFIESKDRETFYDSLKLNKNSKHKIFGSLKNRFRKNCTPTELYHEFKLGQKWKEGQLSNYEYLYYLNLISNRSFHIAQRYPIYPIVLKELDLDELNMNVVESSYENNQLDDLNESAQINQFETDIDQDQINQNQLAVNENTNQNEINENEIESNQININSNPITQHTNELNESQINQAINSVSQMQNDELNTPNQNQISVDENQNPNQIEINSSQTNENQNQIDQSPSQISENELNQTENNPSQKNENQIIDLNSNELNINENQNDQNQIHKNQISVDENQNPNQIEINPNQLNENQYLNQNDQIEQNIFRDLSLTTYMNYNDVECQMVSFPLNDVIVFTILVRSEPFTRLEVKYQSYIDTKRLFDSTKKFWNRIRSNEASEIPPEIFTFPFYLINENGYNLGPNENVQLPKWSLNHFVYTNVQRILLENAYVKNHLMNWFDFIFGLSQNTYRDTHSKIFKPTFSENDVFLYGCLPDQICIQSDILRKSSSISFPVQVLLETFSFLNNQNFDKQLFFNDLFKSSSILNLKKEILYYKTQSEYFLYHDSTIYKLSCNLGEFIDYSNELKIAIFANLRSNYIIIKSLQSKSESYQCHTRCNILALNLIGNRYLLLAGNDCSIQIWDMSTFKLISMSFYHHEEITSIGGNHDLGVIVSIDKANKVIIETLYTHKFIAGFTLNTQNIHSEVNQNSTNSNSMNQNSNELNSSNVDANQIDQNSNSIDEQVNQSAEHSHSIDEQVNQPNEQLNQFNDNSIQIQDKLNDSNQINDEGNQSNENDNSIDDQLNQSNNQFILSNEINPKDSIQLIQVFKSGLICICFMKKLFILDIRGKPIQTIEFNKIICDCFKMYSNDRREFLIMHLKNHSIVVFDLTIFRIIGQISIENKENVHICPLKGKNSILFICNNEIGQIDFTEVIPMKISTEIPKAIPKLQIKNWIE